MQSSKNPHSSGSSSFKPSQSFDEYRVKHGEELRNYKSIDDPVSHSVSIRRRAQIAFAIFAFLFAIALTFLITRR